MQNRNAARAKNHLTLSSKKFAHRLSTTNQQTHYLPSISKVIPLSIARNTNKRARRTVNYRRPRYQPDISHFKNHHKHPDTASYSKTIANNDNDMVVPVASPQKYAGNGLSIRKKTNDGHLTVAGNGCLVKISENSGLVEVLGNGCHVVVKRGTGSVVYVGNGGLVEAAPGVTVTYKGCAGKVLERARVVKKAKEVKFGKSVVNVFNENGKHIELASGRFVLPKIRVNVN